MNANSTIAAHIWLLNEHCLSEQELAGLFLLLSPAETLRYRRFVRPQRQRQFLIGRSLLRLALGKLLGVPPVGISLSERAGNAPLLNWPAPAPFFSISHSGPWVACAVSQDSAVGLDIEMKDPGRELEALAAQAFDQDEMSRFNKLAVHERLTGFYELWSSKEARYKLASSINSNSYSNEAAHCLCFAHPELSVVLCSEFALSESPSLVEVTLHDDIFD